MVAKTCHLIDQKYETDLARVLAAALRPTTCGVLDKCRVMIFLESLYMTYVCVYTLTCRSKTLRHTLHDIALNFIKWTIYWIVFNVRNIVIICTIFSDYIHVIRVVFINFPSEEFLRIDYRWTLWNSFREVIFLPFISLHEICDTLPGFIRFLYRHVLSCKTMAPEREPKAQKPWLCVCRPSRRPCVHAL